MAALVGPSPTPPSALGSLGAPTLAIPVEGPAGCAARAPSPPSRTSRAAAASSAASMRSESSGCVFVGTTAPCMSTSSSASDCSGVPVAASAVIATLALALSSAQSAARSSSSSGGSSSPATSGPRAMMRVAAGRPPPNGPEMLAPSSSSSSGGGRERALSTATVNPCPSTAVIAVGASDESARLSCPALRVSMKNKLTIPRQHPHTTPTHEPSSAMRLLIGSRRCSSVRPDGGRPSAEHIRSTVSPNRMPATSEHACPMAAALSVLSPNATPIVQSSVFPICSITVLSMKPKPTIGTAATRACR
mmetsp:Transcript_11413/g.29673  ORF Transcript_11413/g.29673 Transcript_11413/m.29673 type:complete len:305 (-) Transcript_11413:72-986(-)